jgi:hypothetical protein
MCVNVCNVCVNVCVNVCANVCVCVCLCVFAYLRRHALLGCRCGDRPHNSVDHGVGVRQLFEGDDV